MQAAARTVRFNDDALIVDLEDSRTISSALEWYPRLLHGSPAERGKWELITGKPGILAPLAAPEESPVASIASFGDPLSCHSQFRFQGQPLHTTHPPAG